jgi:hypothetical protein
MKDVIKDVIISILTGFGLHQTASFTHKMPEGYEQIFGTSIGVVGTLPVFMLWLKRLSGIKNPFTWAVSAFLIAFLCVGIGVSGGWFWDTLFNIDRGHGIKSDTEEK